MLFKTLEPRSVSHVLVYISVIKISHMVMLMQRGMEENGICLVSSFTMTALDF